MDFSYFSSAMLGDGLVGVVTVVDFIAVTMTKRSGTWERVPPADADAVYLAEAEKNLENFLLPYSKVSGVKDTLL